MVMPTTLNAFSTKLRTVCVSPVARTKSSGVSCCSINHMHYFKDLSDTSLDDYSKTHVNVVTSMTPVTLGVNVAQKQTGLVAHFNVGNSSRNLTRDKGLTTSGRLVVEQDPVASKHVVCLAVVDKNPVSILFCDALLRYVVSICDFYYELKFAHHREIEGKRALSRTVESQRLCRTARKSRPGKT